MLGLTTEKRANERYSQEHDLRVKAEARVAGLSLQVAFLKGELARLQTHFDRQQALFLEHLAPVRESLPATAGNAEPSRELSAAEIEAQPAVTKREMALRARRASEARIRDLGDQVRKDMEERLKLLNSQEREEMGFDDTLGIIVPKFTAAQMDVPQPVSAVEGA